MELTNNQTEEQEVITDIALIEQDKSTVKILQEDDLKNLKDAVEKIKSFKRKYALKKVRVTDIKDKAQLEKLRLAIADVRTTKTGLEKDKKEKTLPYRNTTAYINANYDKVIEAAEDLLDPMKAHKKEVDDLIEAEEKKAELELQQRVNDRVSKIIAAGMVFDGQYYAIGSEEFNVVPISLGIVDIQTMTDGIFENILQQATEKNAVIVDAIEKANAETKRLEKERIERELEDKRLFDLQQAQLKKEQEELANEMAEFKKQKEELRLAQEKLVQDRLDEENRLKQEEQNKKDLALKQRYSELFSLGMKLDAQNGGFTYKDVGVNTLTQLVGFNEAEWKDLIEKITLEIAEIKLTAENKAIEEKAISDKVIADKAIADKKAQDELDEKNRIESLNKQGDQAIWNDFISRLKAITYPKVKSNDFHIKFNNVRSFIDSLK